MVNAPGAALVGCPITSLLGQTDEALLAAETAQGMRDLGASVSISLRVGASRRSELTRICTSGSHHGV